MCNCYTGTGCLALFLSVYLLNVLSSHQDMRRNQRRVADLNSTIRKLEDRNSLLVDERNELVWVIVYPWIELFSMVNDYLFLFYFIYFFHWYIV